MATKKTSAKTAAAKSAAKTKTAGRKTKKAAPKSSASPKKRTSTSRSKRPARVAGDEEVTLDRRRTSRRGEEATEPTATAPKLERRAKVQRRRQIDPTTCERDYSDAEVEFMNAMDEYKRVSGRMFPTCSEVLEVIRGLSYVQLTAAEMTLLGRDEKSEEEEAAAVAAAESDGDVDAETDAEIEESIEAECVV